ncbi:MAG: hypothetical protein EOO13_15330 [Chitinophagaceae bacterium]|nr:MAG: hypothetical protein EOO13_15330 [Chitinophagaceae bacterium]
MVLEKVRLATAENHQYLEAQLLPYLEHIDTKDQYGTLLNAFYGYIHPVQELIHSNIDTTVVPDIQKRRNAALILGDLDSLGLPLSNERSTSLPAISDHASAMGALYVLEGSTLGGKIISKKIADRLNITEGLLFFRGYGSETGPMWKDFTQYLEHPANQEHAEKLAYTASETFRLFGTWFENQLSIVKQS